MQCLIHNLLSANEQMHLYKCLNWEQSALDDEFVNKWKTGNHCHHIKPVKATENKSLIYQATGRGFFGTLLNIGASLDNATDLRTVVHRPVMHPYCTIKNDHLFKRANVSKEIYV